MRQVEETMHEPIIFCPSCNTEIKLTESLAAPLVETTRREYEKRLAQKDADMAKREAAIHEQQESVARAKEELDQQVAERMRAERMRIAAEEAKKAKLVVQNDLDQKAKELTDLQHILRERETKLAEAQQTQAEFLRKERELNDATRELELTVEKRVREGLATTREQAKKEAEEGLKLKVMEKEQTIASMQRQIEELNRKAEQGSQQLQGEVQELELEALLKANFSRDTIEPVPKGEHGGDVLQHVLSQTGLHCGTIIWESKRTKNWSDGWLAKLREDQRMAKAEIAVLVSHSLPKGVEAFDLVEGIWVAHPRVILPMGIALRSILTEVSSARQASQGQQTKTEQVYQYLTGPRFRQRIEAIVEAFTVMQKDLDKEKMAITKQWAKREEQIDRVMKATIGMYGDLQGIAGTTMQEIESLELVALMAPVSTASDSISN
jgi:hypothetical protein